MSIPLDHNAYYRLPWSYSDNGISWLEPTTKCNLRCQGCYRDLEHPVHKTLDQVRADLEVFKKLRKSDCMSIAGGDPLVYPDIVPLVRMVRDMGWKPIVNTNGLALTEDLLGALKKAGVFGFTFHIDTSQNRPGAKGWSEIELNALRLRYARMVAAAGGLACSFNATITTRTLEQVPALVDWARQHADIVQTMVFILFRAPDLSGKFNYFAQGKPIDFGDTYKETEWGGGGTVFAQDIVDRIKRADPLYQPAAYLNGTANPDSLKWLLANRVVLNRETIGYVSPRFMELVQTLKHIGTGSYLAYAGPATTRTGKLSAFLGGLTDRHMRGILAKILGRTVTRPLNLFKRAYLQSIMIIQPVNYEADGAADMCDGCPDMTVHDGKLVWSCRLEELHQFGAFVDAAPRQPAPATAATKL